MIPRPALFAWFMIPTIPLAVGIWVPWLTPVGWSLNVAFLLLAALDVAFSPWPRSLGLARRVGEVLSVGVENPVTLTLANGSRRTLRLRLTDSPPQPSRARGLPLELALPAGRRADATYLLRPERRGTFDFREIFVRYRSVLGLWDFNVRRATPTTVRVFPDIRPVEGFHLLARRNQLRELGLKLWRLRGKEGEFERLREYRREDEIRTIDWKATAKRDTLISREFTVERNQNILFLLDTGRPMVLESDGVTHLDRSINAALMLSYIALGQGDNVGLVAFSNKLERVVTQVRGRSALQTLIHHVFDLEARWQASDYGLVCEQLLQRQRKRALVVLLTSVQDGQQIETLARYVRPLARTHLFLCVFLGDTGLADLAAQSPDNDDRALESAAAASLIEELAMEIARLRDAGVFVLETQPARLTSDVINQYLELKARHLL
ncbi:MAG: DUF58 domain-containing protein [Planctomycetota bacterium]